jgi:hypothetical protein
MSVTRRGLSIGVCCIEGKAFVEMRAIGKLTHEDYQTITPMIEDAIAASDDNCVDVLADLREFEGWEARAAWDDFKLGIKHRKSWGRIALVGSKKWEQLAAKVAGWFIGGETKFFEDIDAALQWIGSE